jgi:hypothetical protein
MADKKSSQAQHDGFAFFQKMLSGHFDRLDTWYEQAEKLQQKSFEQAEQAMTNATELGQASMKYTQKLTQDFWKIGVDVARQSTEAFSKS